MAIQRLRLVVPPALSELVRDETYARYFSRNPRMPAGVRSEYPWQLIVRRAQDAEGSTWAVRMVPAYADAWRRARRMIDDPRWEDVVICSRSALFRPPIGFSWDLKFQWCGRCRRPTLFRRMQMHPVISSRLEDSLRHAIMLAEDRPMRCYYCGARQSSMPHYKAR